jgi:membrane protease YdiL (CAAX protease family)
VPDAQLVIVVAGSASHAGAWWLVASRHRDLWKVMPPILVAMAVGAVLVRRPVLAAEVTAGIAFGVGVAVGVALYLATRAFVAVATRWAPFRLATREIYGEARPVPLGVAIALSLVVMVPSEELFWRGLVQMRLADGIGAAGAALVTWAAYVGVNLPSRSSPIVLAAAVGGAVWAGLAWWSGGMFASFVSHVVWTGLMLGLPPAPGREMLQG